MVLYSEKGLVKHRCCMVLLLHGFVLGAHASDKINEIHGARPQMPTLNSQFSFGLQQTPVCFHTPATGRAADLEVVVGGGGGGGGGSSFPANN